MPDERAGWREVSVRTTRISVVVVVLDDDTGERLPTARVRLADGTRPATVSGGYHVFTDLGPDPVEAQVRATGFDEATPTLMPVGPDEIDPGAFVTEVRLAPY